MALGHQGHSVHALLVGAVVDGDALGLHLGFRRHDGCSVIGSLLLDPFQGQIDQHPQDDNGDEDKKSGQQSLDGIFHSRSLLFFSQDWL